MRKRKRKRALLCLNTLAGVSLAASLCFDVHEPRALALAQPGASARQGTTARQKAANSKTSYAKTSDVKLLYAQATHKPKDGTARQTADIWAGSPLGPGGDFEDPARADQLRIKHVMDLMGLKEGSVVADVGAGGGWFTMIAAKRVGPTGTVYAEEINDEYTKYIDERAAKAGFKNIKTILGTTDDPKLPENKLDAVLILNAYHEFEQPLAMLRKIKTAMKPGGRLAFIERDDDQLRLWAEQAYKKTGLIKRRVEEKPDDDPRTDDHRLALPVVRREAESVGFRKYRVTELRDDHYVLVVEKP